MPFTWKGKAPFCSISSYTFFGLNTQPTKMQPPNAHTGIIRRSVRYSMKSPNAGKVMPLVKSNQMPLIGNAACDMVYRQPIANITTHNPIAVGVRFQWKRSVKNATMPSISEMLLVSAANSSSR